MQTDPEWPATRLHLQSIRQEYNAIDQELTAESDWRRRDQLMQWKIACSQEFVQVLQEWHDQTKRGA